MTINRKPVRNWDNHSSIKPPSDAKNRYEAFRYIIMTMAEQFKMTKDAGIMSCLRVLENELCQRILDESTGGMVEQNRMKLRRTTYIEIFMQKFHLVTNLQYQEAIDGSITKAVEKTVTELDKYHMSAEEYLEWFFETVTNPRQGSKLRIAAPSIKTSLSSHFLMNFLAEHQEEIRRRTEKVDEAQRAQAVLGQIRSLMRQGLSTAELKSALERYSKREISLDELIKEVEKIQPAQPKE